MAELRPIPFPQLLRRILDEPARQGTLFDLPLRKCYRPNPAVDLSVDVHSHRAQNAVGPAAGPHAQMAQNIVLAWLGGARIIELKTVQVKDRLTIPRPCIDAATIGFNVEWSQELVLAESLKEYAAGWMLVRMLRHLDPLGLGAHAEAAHPVFELSVGYDLAGLQSPQMRRYLAAVRDVGPLIATLRDEIPVEQRALRDLDYRADMVSCVTLSTFHGCPAHEIEEIVRYLLVEFNVDVIVKLNPTLIGYDEVRYLLHDRMGYHELRPKRAAFDGDLRWDDAIAMGQRLSSLARTRGRSFGVKMTNTLVVENHKTFFRDPEMYLSGPPLHVLAMHCVERWRAVFGASIPISFSGGIDAHNVVDAVACDLVPVTTCTDLLRPGGYGRLPRYLENLEEAMVDLGARDRAELILRRFGQAPEAVRGVFAEMREQGERLGLRGPRTAEAAERLLAAYETELLATAKGRERPLAETVAGFQRRVADVAGREVRSVFDDLTHDLHERLVRAAGLLNGHEVAQRVTGDPRYAAGKNSKPPRKVGSQLVLLDCISCDKCVPVCPNDANFAIDTPLEEVAYDDLVLDESGSVRTVAGAGVWKVARPRQWANYADACNECGNCDVFCPEDGGPYVVKARFFGSPDSFERSPDLEGLFLDGDGERLTVRARIGGARYQLTLPPGGPAIVDDGVVRAEYHPETGALLGAAANGSGAPTGGAHRLSGAIFLTLRALVRGALDGRKLNPVNARVSARWPGDPTRT